jgi:NADH dehydrogenase
MTPAVAAASGGSADLPRFVVIGGGFAGLWAVRALAREQVAITLVDRANHHLFQPLLYQVATAGLSAPDIAAPLRHILREQRNVDVRLGEVTGIDLAARRITFAVSPAAAGAAAAPGSPADEAARHAAAADVIDYDMLLVASGSTHAYFGHDEWATHAPGLKTLDDALTIRRRVLTAFERAEGAAARGEVVECDAWLHFAVVGAGPTGVELAGTMAEIARHTLRHEFRHIDPSRARVRLIEAGPAVLASFPPALQAKARAQLERLGVEVATGTPVGAIDASGYRLGEQMFPCRTVLWAAGVAASPLGKALAGTAPAGTPQVELDRAGRVKVRADLTLPGRPEVFVAGDLASLTQPDGRAVPGIAPAAKQMGSYVAQRVRARLAGGGGGSGSESGEAPPFTYQDYGNLATIGRMAAVVDLRGLRFSGVLAWWFWLAAHVFFLIGFRNRLLVLLNWGWAYFTYQRHARIVHGGTVQDPPP